MKKRKRRCTNGRQHYSANRYFESGFEESRIEPALAPLAPTLRRIREDPIHPSSFLEFPTPTSPVTTYNWPVTSVTNRGSYSQRARHRTIGESRFTSHSSVKFFDSHADNHLFRFTVPSCKFFEVPLCSGRSTRPVLLLDSTYGSLCDRCDRALVIHALRRM